MHETMRPVWVWHAIEETEHKAVTYDVFNQVGQFAGLAIDNEHLCTRVFERITQFRHCMTRVEWHYNQSAGRHANVAFNVFMRVV